MGNFNKRGNFFFCVPRRLFCCCCRCWVRAQHKSQFLCRGDENWSMQSLFWVNGSRLTRKLFGKEIRTGWSIYAVSHDEAGTGDWNEILFKGEEYESGFCLSFPLFPTCKLLFERGRVSDESFLKRSSSNPMKLISSAISFRPPIETVGKKNHQHSVKAVVVLCLFDFLFCAFLHYFLFSQLSSFALHNFAFWGF